MSIFPNTSDWDSYDWFIFSILFGVILFIMTITLGIISYEFREQENKHELCLESVEFCEDYEPEDED